MQTQTIVSTDGKRIAYDVSGRGPALMLLHGAGNSRSDWHKVGYVERLQQDFTVITVDLRGSGESELGYDVADYAIEKICDDLLRVADACHVTQFGVWGFSFGGNIARYLGATADRISALAAVGVPLATIPDALDRFIEAYEQKWGPLLAGYRAGTLNAEERERLLQTPAVIWLPCFQAMRTWPIIGPEAIKCPTLVVAGTQNEPACQWITANRNRLEASKILIETIPDLTHLQEFTEIDRVFPPIREFFQATLH